MEYDALVDFIERGMRMSHVYQPVMLLSLLQGGGHTTTEQIARAILMHDESQVEYYEKITNDMPGTVLRKHRVVEKNGNVYRLLDFIRLTPAQREHLTGLCKEKLANFIERRGEQVWQHRRECPRLS